VRAKLREPFVFFIDECLGALTIRAALEAACCNGETIMTLPQGTLDTEWLTRAGGEGWVCFSKDKRMLHVPNELAAIINSGVGLFTLGSASGAKHAQLLVNALPIVRRAAKQLKRAFVARIDPSGALIVVIKDGQRLDRSQRIEPNMHEWPPRPDVGGKSDKKSGKS
jgi:hypothetical protein